MIFTTKQFNTLLAIVGGLLVWLLLSAVSSPFADGTYARRYLIALGGGPNGYIQAICYGLAIYTFLELRGMIQALNKESEALAMHLLPEQEHLVLSPEEVARIKLGIIDLEKKGLQNMLTNLILKTCNQYRNENSVSDTYSMLFSQMRTLKERLESKTEIPKYVISAISMLGFIGTIIGLSNGIFSAAPLMAQVNPDEKMAGMKLITGDFSLAFGSTLVALLLMIWLSRYYHRYLSKLDTYFATAENYVIENLISRIYKG